MDLVVVYFYMFWCSVSEISVLWSLSKFLPRQASPLSFFYGEESCIDHFQAITDYLSTIWFLYHLKWSTKWRFKRHNMNSFTSWDPRQLLRACNIKILITKLFGNYYTTVLSWKLLWTHISMVSCCMSLLY